MRVFFYVQHLLGIGHLKRASVLASSLTAAGHDVAVVLGGPEMPEIGFPGCARIQLPPVRAADASFKVLVDGRGRPIDEAFRDRRAHRLLAEFTSLRPEVLLIEQYPFGRRQLRFELLPLMEAARARPQPPAIICSLRDILVQKADDGRTGEMLAIARRLVDRIFVHGDPRLIPLDASFPAAAELADKITYTGYVSEPLPPPTESTDGAGEVIVLVGGGAVGETLLRTALATRPLTSLASSVWRLITGPNLPHDAFAEIAWRRPPGVIVERWRSDLRALLLRARLAISQAGYNSVMDLLATRVPAVVVPFSSARESEQTQRARLLAARGAFTLVEAERPSPKVLAIAVEQALTRLPAFVDVDFSGAETTAKLLTTMLDEGARPREGR